MTTDEIMAIAVKMAGFRGMPEDSAMFVGGRNIRKVLFGVDVGPAELMTAKELGMDLVIAHHPTGVYIDQWKVLLRHVEFMTSAGVPEDAALGAVAERIEATKLPGQISNFDHYIHIDYGDLQRPRAEGRGNLIVTGHLAGDSLGFTPFIAELRRRGLQVTTFSGVIDAAT
jgi:hypothetical protein